MTSQEEDPLASVTQDVQCRRCGSGRLRLERKEKGLAAVVCEVCERPVARLHEDERRLAWPDDPLDEALEQRVAGEKEKYDAWAAAHAGELNYPSRPEITLDRWFGRSAAMRRARKRWPALGRLSGKRVLDIGGSCKDTWRFVPRAARIDQVEVSSASQRVAAERLEQALRGTEADWRETVWFHTAPAERLPFAAATFDLVFSRSTIHHVQRPAVFEEIHRVLKPGGLMFILEPRYSLFLYALMKLSRLVRGVDRGTDDPLRTAEIHALRNRFREVDWYPSRIFSTLWKQSVGRVTDTPTVDARLKRLDRALGSTLGLAYPLGSFCWVGARK